MMPFWKKREDPWDRKPEQVKKVPVQPAEIPAWHRTEEPPEPEECPWCGQPMLAGYLYSTGTACTGMYWQEGPAPRGGFLDALFGEDTSGVRRAPLGGCERAWCCGDCRRLVLNVPHPDSGREFEEALEKRYQALQKKPKENDI